MTPAPPPSPPGPGVSAPAPAWREGDPDAIRLADAIEVEAWEDQLAACPGPLAAALGMRFARVAGAAAMVVRAIPGGQFNRAVGLGVEAPASERDVDELVAFFEAAGAPGFWLQTHTLTRPEALAGWLAARGFGPAPRPSWVKVLHGGGPLPVVATDLEVREVGRAHAAELARAIAAGFGMPAAIAPWVEAYVERPGWRAYAAFERGGDGVASERIVAGAMLYQRGERAWLGLGATLPTHRRRGAQGALLVRRIADARAGGASAIATETGEPVGDEHNPSLANMLRTGFVRVCSRANWTRRA